MKTKRFLSIAAMLVILGTSIVSSYAQGVNGKGKGQGKGDGTCPRLTQSYSNLQQQYNRPSQNKGSNAGNAQRSRIMDPTNPYCPLNNW
jgi:hypothetical protein